ncbi:MAG: flagellin lysine-N-methylase [Clostridia bacterium]|nr:flagellin lysine-N-methylase [Clostridia bacterium]
MHTVRPDYYDKFECTAEKCRHNCCIGWEIDIDEYTLAYYDGLEDKIGQRIRNNITRKDTACFKMTENGRCPMLNDNGLCEIMLNLGTDSVCDICYEHPRFYNEYDSHTECGLGLCCEAVCRLVIDNSDTVKLIGLTDKLGADRRIAQRKKVISILQDRSKPIEVRMRDMLCECGVNDFDISVPCWTDKLFKLERLSDDWTRNLDMLKRYYSPDIIEPFKKYMSERQTEYEQLAVYLIYRYMLTAEPSPRAAILFTYMSYRLTEALGAVLYAINGRFTIDDQLEIIRQYSSEIEYSTDNLDILTASLCELVKKET